MQVESFSLHRTHLHFANVKALWPTVSHAIYLIHPGAEITISREENGNLGFFCTTSKPRSGSLLLEHPTKNSLFESGELFQNVIHWKIKPVNLDLANECREFIVLIHSSNVEVHVPTSNSIMSLVG